MDLRQLKPLVRQTLSEIDAGIVLVFDAEIEHLAQQFLTSGTWEKHRAVPEVWSDDLQPCPLVSLRLHGNEGKHQMFHLLNDGFLASRLSGRRWRIVLRMALPLTRTLMAEEFRMPRLRTRSPIQGMEQEIDSESPTVADTTEFLRSCYRGREDQS